MWDVLGACVREGSLDAAIRHPQANDFDLLHRRAPRLWRVGFNGGTAGRFAKDFARAGFETVVLPSSSPAHAARSFEQKFALWRALLADDWIDGRLAGTLTPALAKCEGRRFFRARPSAQLTCGCVAAKLGRARMAACPRCRLGRASSSAAPSGNMPR